MASSFHLLVAFPDKEPVSYSLSGPKLALGRSPANDIQILVREVSTEHCEFNLTENGYEITDSGSTNGTKVNDRSLKEAQVLNHRDSILLGETIPVYFIEAEEGAEIDMKAEIAAVEAASLEPKTPTVKQLTAPGGPPTPSLPTKKPLVSMPLAQPTPAEGANVGGATVKLASPARPTTKLGSPPPPATKLAVPGPPAPVKKAPAVTKSPATPPVKKLAPPGATPEPTPASPPIPAPAPAPAKTEPDPPAVSAPAPAVKGPAVKKLAAPSLSPPTKSPSLSPPTKSPSLPTPESAPAKKLAVPAKKAAPKLNFPKKDD